MKCDECGCGVKAEDIVPGGATRVFVTPDSALSNEMYETICGKCNHPAPEVKAKQKKAKDRKRINARCACCLEHKPLETNRHCAECAKTVINDNQTYENELRKQMGLPPKTVEA